MGVCARDVCVRVRVCACACACVRVCMLVRLCSADSCCTSISLTKNNIGADGAGALGALLRDNTVLQSLDISAPAPHSPKRIPPRKVVPSRAACRLEWRGRARCGGAGSGAGGEHVRPPPPSRDAPSFIKASGAGRAGGTAATGTHVRD